MSSMLTALLAGIPWAACWSLHVLWCRRRIERARRDPLTGLPGRSAFEAHAQRLMRAGSTAVALVDLNDFKAVNDDHGHAAGDAALVTTAERLVGWAELHRGCAARLGGDEFALVLPAPDDLPSALGTLHAVLCRPVPYRQVQLLAGASIGAFVAEGLPEPARERAMRLADEAMYAAKRNGGGWQVAESPVPSMTTTRGRRTGRRGTSAPAARWGGSG
ncbi:GGDEF domain-containing protein [Streptomyces sp. NPDC001262]|uniref:GGDEF domain-containing protein n=1 Tax=Streptomyces sp. NPDC001262 TaxID=3364552 RepID=UPI0036985083